MIQRLQRLRLDAVVGRNDEDDDGGRLGAARAHERKCLMTGRIEEGNLAPLFLDLVGADMLRDAARFLVDDVGRPEGVQQ